MGQPFIGGELYFTADFVDIQQIIPPTYETTFLCKMN